MPSRDFRQFRGSLASSPPWIVILCLSATSLPGAFAAHEPCLLTLMSASSGNLSSSEIVTDPGTGLRCQSWLISPGSTEHAYRVEKRSFTLTISRLTLGVSSDSFEVYSRRPAPQSDRLISRFTPSTEMELPMVLQVEQSPGILVVLKASSNETALELEYTSGFDAPLGNTEVVSWVLFMYASLCVVFLGLAITTHIKIRRRRRAARASFLAAKVEHDTEAALKELPTKLWEASSCGEGKETDCPLCLEPFRQSEVVRILGCNHYYHAACIDKWFACRRGATRTCPLCKQDPLVVIEDDWKAGEAVAPAGRLPAERTRQGGLMPPYGGLAAPKAAMGEAVEDLEAGAAANLYHV